MKSQSRRQHGAAMVEFVIGAVFVLVPMYLAVQALGKFADVQHSADAAARYAAWEKTVWFEDTGSKFFDHNKPNQKSAAQIRNELMVRLVNDRRSDLKYKDSDKGATTFANGIDPLWHDADDLAYLPDPAKLAQSSARLQPAADLVGKALALFESISIPSITGTLAPPVPSDTLATTTVRLDKVAADSQVYKRLWSKDQSLPEDWPGLDFQGSSGVLTNTWAANASGGTRDMVAESVPTAQGLGMAVKAGALATMAVWDPLEAPRLDIGKITPDVVPDDRLK